MGVPVGHTDSFIPVDLYVDPPNHFKLHFWELFFDIFGTFLEIFSKNLQNQKNLNFFNENQSCSPRNSMHFALVKQFWGPFFDHFVDLQILTIWGQRSGSDAQPKKIESPTQES